MTLFGNFMLLKSKRLLYIAPHSIETDEIVKILQILVGEIVFAYSDREATAQFEDLSFEYIIIDVIEPDKKVIELIQRLRHIDYSVPIIIFSDKDTQEMLMDITNLSIDAYLYKPLAYETLTHILSHSMQRNAKENGLVVLNKELIFNLATKELFYDGTMINLGSKELQLFLLLIKNRNRTLTKEEIEKELWPLQGVSDSAIKKLILRIRNKIKSDIIISVRGIGYRLNTRETQKIEKMLVSA
jgi:two-component system, OmpR family, response regulator VanR